MRGKEKETGRQMKIEKGKREKERQIDREIERERMRNEKRNIEKFD